MNDVVVNGGRPFAALLQQIKGGQEVVLRISPQKGEIEGGHGVMPSEQALGPANSAQAMLARYATPVDLSTTKNDDLVMDAYGRPAFDRLENRIRQQPKLLSTYAFATRGGTQPGIAAVFSGAAGLGKALGARVMAVRLEKDLYRLDLDKVLGDTAAETLKNISAAIGLAAQLDVILLIENIDALLGDNSRDHSQRDPKLLSAGIAQKLRNQSGLVLITAQNPNFGPEFHDALTDKINFRFPDAPMRLEIWKRAFPADVPKADLPFDRIAHHEMSGAAISRAALSAAAAACAEQKPVSVDHVKDAIRLEAAASGRCVTERDFNY